MALPKPWIIERALGWLNLYQRLSKGYERSTKAADTIIQITMIHNMFQKIST
ncbi:transposase [Pontibacter rugosus]|uniref:Transposase n=1 Tax=Pontibacter rugosus TaxID=1745966 RepID=A0ABW3STN6_9BACT